MLGLSAGDLPELASCEFEEEVADFEPVLALDGQGGEGGGHHGCPLGLFDAAEEGAELDVVHTYDPIEHLFARVTRAGPPPIRERHELKPAGTVAHPAAIIATMNSADREQLADRAIRELLTLHQTSRFEVAPGLANEAVALGYGWATRVVRTAEAVRQLHETGFAAEASPLVRNVVVHAAALVWLRDDPTTVVEAAHYDFHEKGKPDLFDLATEAGWDLSEVEKVPTRTGQKLPAWRTLRQPQDLFEQVGSEDAYVAYRIESPYSHPSALSADVYFGPDDNATIRAFHDARGQGTAPLCGTAHMAVVALRYFALMLGDHGLVTAVEKIAADGLLPVELDAPRPQPADDSTPG